MLPDVSAKENAQETAVTLAGILGGLLFASYIADPLAAWPVFLALTALHVFANFQGTIMTPGRGLQPASLSELTGLRPIYRGHTQTPPPKCRAHYDPETYLHLFGGWQG